MNKRTIIWIVFFLINAPLLVFAQTHSSLQRKKIFISSDSLVLDTLPVAANSVKIFLKDRSLLNDSLFSVDQPKGIIYFKQSIRDTIEIEYRTFPSIFVQKYFHKDVKMIEPDYTGKTNPFAYVPGTQKTEILSFGTLNKSGSISRGITVGNNQDLSVNSSLNLQLSGKLSDDVEVLAAISDDNIPIQPEGNTQQIQDFDKVYIQLKNNTNVLTAGDFELRRPDSYFMNFYKKAKGGYFTTVQKPTKNSEMKFGVAGAVAKGKYTRFAFTGQEGNQGPYRLRGQNNESFIIVLSGTERVYVDGLLLTRGEDNDYIIDYNTAEITFTQKRLITQYSRISIEFEYSDRNYSRSLIYVNDEFRQDKLTLKINFFSEQDSKNQPLLQTLDDDQKLFLRDISDNIDQAFYPNIDSLGYNENEIRYKKIDSLGYEIYVYSTNSDSAVYRLGFTQLGAGKGNYIQVNSVANGRVFQWVAPVGGLPQGDYEPIVLLVTPKKSQMLTYAGDYQLSKETKILFEGAYSNNDINLYASEGNQDNQGFASKTTIQNSKALRSDSLTKTAWVSSVSFEFVDKNFKFIERYRPVEFERDFNITQAAKANEYLFHASTEIRKNERTLAFYRINTFIRDTLYTGIQNMIGTDLSYKKFTLRSQASLLTTKENVSSTSTVYLKHKADLSKEWKYIVTGIAEEAENNRFNNDIPDTLTVQSFAFQQYQVYLANPSAWENKYRLDYTIRNDYTPRGDNFISSTQGEIINFNSEFNTNSNSRLTLGATYRKLKIWNDQSSQRPEESVLARTQYDLTAWKGLINSNTYYEIGTGQEPKREFSYVQVPPGQGVYIWVDYNSNGVKELNEFEIAKFQYEANYIRVYITSTDFVKTNSAVFSETLNLNPDRVWSSRKGFLKALSLFANQTALKIDRKILDNSNETAFNPFDLSIADTSLITLSSSFRNTFYFQRLDPVFGIDFTYLTNNNKSLLSSGFDTRKVNENTLRTRWNFARSLGLIVEGKNGNKTYTSELLLTKNFDIEFYQVIPELSYQFSTAFRIIFTYDYKQQQNDPALGNEKSINHKMSSEIRYNASGKGSFSAKVSYINNSYNADANTPVAYEMLEGLQVGNNLTWNATVQRNLGNNLQLNFVYDGRKSPGVNTIHSGSVQARAYF